MGANQSSKSSGRADGQAGRPSSNEARTCYYELLGVEPRATEEEIKKAYRKKALELHPDRNYGNVEAATKIFADIQAAYDVLSDPQERAWYDSHRDSILYGDNEASEAHFEHDIRVTTADDILRMFGQFSPRMDFSDSPSGFYASLRETFETLAREENAASEQSGSDPVDYPSFGHADDGYKDVVRPFYATWNGFSTRKTFSWKDRYRYSEAPDRRVRRVMEKENKRAREEGIREFNDAVRSLVAFVRKRDPRYIPNTQSEAERQKVLREATAAQAARSRAANEARIQSGAVVPDWAKSQDQESLDSSEESESTVEHFECVECGKTFKSEKQFEIHEKSKKHFKTMRSLDRNFRKSNEGQHHEPIPKDFVEAQGLSEGEITPLSEAGSEIISAEKAENLSRDELSNELANMEDLGVEDPHEQSRFPASSDLQQNLGSATSDIQSSDDYASREEVESRIFESTSPSAKPSESGIEGSETLSEIDQSRDLPRKLGKAKAKRAKRAAGQKNLNAERSSSQIQCVACGQGFPSRSKLFNHVKALGHAQPVPKPTGKQSKPR
ncbi:MAG: hypothetical protein M1825_000069 [Sarcosagium campestre]|nr:MAG: hypothetical protein M1825_000069 [Sarcosagium campestre]